GMPLPGDMPLPRLDGPQRHVLGRDGSYPVLPRIGLLGAVFVIGEGGWAGGEGKQFRDVKLFLLGGQGDSAVTRRHLRRTTTSGGGGGSRCSPRLLATMMTAARSSPPRHQTSMKAAHRFLFVVVIVGSSCW